MTLIYGLGINREGPAWKFGEDIVRRYYIGERFAVLISSKKIEAFAVGISYRYIRKSAAAKLTQGDHPPRRAVRDPRKNWNLHLHGPSPALPPGGHERDLLDKSLNQRVLLANQLC
jgi:hypothetical protein